MNKGMFRGKRVDNNHIVVGYFLESPHFTERPEWDRNKSYIAINKNSMYEVHPSTVEVNLCGEWILLAEVEGRVKVGE